MVKITEELVRKRSEHNERMIGTLQELSLHQENIEKIEHIHNWCKDLKILLLQSNLISKIENLWKLKKLEYLNLAINNIEIIENLEKLESLQKLDLTLNFIGDLTSVESLRDNYNLRELILTGNPCTDYPGYREFVVTVLPQLTQLDCTDITRTERILAAKCFPDIRQGIIQRQVQYKIRRDEQKIRVMQQLEEDAKARQHLSDEERTKHFWDSKSEHSPEMRVEIARQHSKAHEIPPTCDPLAPPKRTLKLFSSSGRAFCINEPKIDFHFRDKPDSFELELLVYRFLDTAHLSIDVQPNYVRVSVKKKIFQLALDEEVKCDESTSQRSDITGHLLIKMPKLHGKIVKESGFNSKDAVKVVEKDKNNDNKSKCVDYRNIVKDCKDIEDEIPDLI
ncbi:protein tilB isoform X2 [Lutzomyia longipalpis]|uniref:protein tilB isoform X2 n=1 Tax=Lutzomyia longipalpis TaxID=7200 RepID=UPI0024843120|nr:protein tilB isoform X2 [Lutzomyia longipalpis]XP_055682679.1 protein tilB isoform X2 [Lutzomyia longipalpis]